MNTLLPATSSINLSSQNIADCLKEIQNIGNTVYQNVCTGGSSIVPWGTVDWFFSALLIGFIVTLGFVVYKASTA